MQKGKGKGKMPLYIGVFASDPKAANKIVKSACKDAILQVLKHQLPQKYMTEDDTPPNKQLCYELQRSASQQQLAKIQKDFMDYQGFMPPGDNYHCTCLFMGHGKHKGVSKIYQNWQNGHPTALNVDFIVYVPGYLMAGYIQPHQIGKVQCDNKFPHMTLLLRNGATAKESNDVLETLHKAESKIFDKRAKKVVALQVQYHNVTRIMYVIVVRIEMEGVTGDNITHGKK